VINGVVGSAPVLAICELRTHIQVKAGVIKAVDGLNLDLNSGECLALVGESGSGKSITALSVMRLLPPNARIVGGSIRLRGKDLTALDESAMRLVRGGRIALIPQDALAALNPVFTIEDQVANAFRLHRGVARRDRHHRVAEILAEVGIKDPERTARQYPHQLSGGMRQRVTIAMALASEPELLIADEPTTALDVILQRQVIKLIRDLSSAKGMPLLFITHDLALAAEISDRTAVMYAGRVVELGRTLDVLSAPAHPYSQGLVACIPRPQNETKHSLPTIPGTPPDPLSRPRGCRFHPRCSVRVARCFDEYPPTKSLAAGREAACWLA
jgi:peptide/nickel transport system ATP-binding protein